MKFELLLGIAMSAVVAFGGVSAFAAPLSSVIVRQNGNSVEQSYDNGVTWENYAYKETHDFFTYDEYAEWVKAEKEAIRKLVEAGEWTQKQADEVVSHYNEVLSKIKDGLMVSKRKDYNEDQVLFSLPEGMHTTGYQTVVYGGGTFKNFGPFETKEELYNALKEYSDDQVASGIMTQANANDLLKKYE